MSEEIQKLKVDLANAIKMMEHAKFIDFNGHASIRIPGTDHILINERRSSRHSLGPDEIITIDLEGNVVEGEGEPPNEFPLHTRIYVNRSDVSAICHTHPQWSTLFTIANIPIRPVVSQGAVLGDVPVFPKSFSISNKEIADELASWLGVGPAVLMKAHGAAFVGTSILEAYARCVFFEENACRQYMASQLGHAESLSEEEVAYMGKALWKQNNIEKIWSNHLSLL